MSKFIAEHCRQGLTAGEVMNAIDEMIQTSPNKAEAERRLNGVIGHAVSRHEDLAWYWQTLFSKDASQ